MTDRPGDTIGEGELLLELARCIKQTVGMARAYSHGTGSIFEAAMNSAEELANRTLTEPTKELLR